MEITLPSEEPFYVSCVFEDINEFYALRSALNRNSILWAQTEAFTCIESQVQGIHTTLLKKSSHQALKESINQFTVVPFGILHKTIAFILVSLNNARPEKLIPNLLLLSVNKCNALTFTRGCRFGFPLSKFLHEDCISRCTSGSRQAFATPTKWRPTATEAAPTASARTGS